MTQHKALRGTTAVASKNVEYDENFGFHDFVAWNEAQLDPGVSAELDERIAQVQEAAANSPYRGSNELKERVSNLIWEAMEARGLNQAELARRLGKSRAYVSKLLSGGQNLTLESLAQLGEVLDCDWAVALSPTRPMLVNPVPPLPLLSVLDIEKIEAEVNHKPLVTPVPVHAFRAVSLTLVSDSSQGLNEKARLLAI